MYKYGCDKSIVNISMGNIYPSTLFDSKETAGIIDIDIDNSNTMCLLEPLLFKHFEKYEITLDIIINYLEYRGINVKIDDFLLKNKKHINLFKVCNYEKEYGIISLANADFDFEETFEW